jgi:flagellar hook-associated protein 3 FlgL
MIYNTISTMGIAKRLHGTLSDLQFEMLKTNDEVASGKHYDMAAALGSRTGQDITLRNLYDTNEQDLAICTLYKGQMTAMDAALTNMLKAGQDILASASTGLGGQSPTGSSLQIGARGVLDQIVGLLNASSGNGYLFAGIDTGTVPMRHVDGDALLARSPMQIVKDAIAAATGGPSMPATAAETTAVIATLDNLFSVRDPATAAPAPLTDTYEGGFYVGTTTMQPGGAAQPRQAARTEDATTIPYGIQANDPSFRSLIEGLYMLSAVDTSQMNELAYPDYIKTAVDRISGGLSGIREATAMLGVQRAQVDDAVERHQVQKKILSDQINAMEGVDPAEASTRLDQIQAQLDAAASATSRISRMSLVNYL